MKGHEPTARISRLRPHQDRWALILTGGGNRGATQAGAVLALFESGFVPDLILGVSIGAINGAYLAFYPNVGGAGRLTDLWRYADERRLFGTRFPRLRGLAAVLLGRPSAYSNDGFEALLTTHLPGTRFEETAIPLAVAATDLESGAARTLDAGEIIPAVLASAAAPAHFPPVIVNGERLIDGSLADPVPFHVAAQRGIRKAVVIEPGGQCTCRHDYRSALSVALQSVSILAHRCQEIEFAAAKDNLEVIHVRLTCEDELPMSDLSKTDVMIDSGYEEASAMFDAFETLPWAPSPASRHQVTAEPQFGGGG
ncbi:MAG: patatin-like phospholipase family protein [Acidimicrobiia bacterium]|nr:MAG: patatin-like phospholipase family protein [Acidimicrobiia bacterium]